MAGAFDWSRYAVGGATRPDSFTGMKPAFNASLQALFAAAPPELGLQVGSGYRSIERQRQLWEASDKSGRMVARPGGSRHNHGDAADLSAAGKRLDKASPEARQWVHDNAGKYGLTFPMSYEPWHIELAGARGGKSGAASALQEALAGGGSTLAPLPPARDVAAPAAAFGTTTTPSEGTSMRNSPLVAAMADRSRPAGPGRQAAGPAVAIGLPPEKGTALERAMLARVLGSGQNMQNAWDVVGGLAQVYALNSTIKDGEKSEASALTKAYADANFTPDEMAIATAKGGREGFADVLTARQANAQRADERSYERGRDSVADQRWQAQQDRQASRDAVSDRQWAAEQAARADGTVPAGYRRTETGLEPVPGGPADPARADANFKPDLQTIYTEDGREQKGYFGRDGAWTPMGGQKAPSSGGGVTISPDGTVQVGGGVKVPANFMPDPNNPGAVTPIPGGPGEQLPAELAGRIAIADSFLDQAPGIRERLSGGEATGLWDRFQAGNNASSDQAGVYRQLQSGADALQRLLTGAGMNDAEARAYADRYLPGYTDDAASAASKLDQMQREIENARAAALRGRGGAGAAFTPNGPTPAGSRTSAGGSIRSKYGLE